MMAKQRLNNIIASTVIALFLTNNCAPQPTLGELPSESAATPTIIVPTLEPTSLPIPTITPAIQSPQSKFACNDLNRVLKINVNYRDNPTLIDWDEPFEGDPDFVPVSDELFLEDVLQITSANVYGMDAQVHIFANSIEFAVKFGENARIYANLKLQSTNETTKDMHFDFRPGIAEPIRVSDEEWIVFIDAKPIKEEWYLFVVDLHEVVRDTETSQWHMINFNRLRVRGNITIAFICLYA